MARDGLNELTESHFPPLRMQKWLLHHFRGNRPQQRQVPTAYTREGHQGSLRIVARIVARPDLLVEGLDDMMLLRQSLAYTIAEDQFAIRQMAQDFVGAPLSRGRGFLDAHRAESN